MLLAKVVSLNTLGYFFAVKSENGSLTHQDCQPHCLTVAWYFIAYCAHLHTGVYAHKEF